MHPVQSTLPEWYYETNGSPSGPVDASSVVGMLRAGQLQATSRVWRPGMADWAPLGNVVQFRDAFAPAAAPTAPSWSLVAQSGPGPRREETWTILLLGLVTFGIYPMVRFFQAAKSYLALLPGRQSNFETLFWVYLGLVVLGGLTLVIGVGVLLLIGALVLGAMALGEVMDARTELVRGRALPVQLTPPQTHATLWVVGNLTSIILFGWVLLLIQAVKFFDDHNAIAQALGAGPPHPGPSVFSGAVVHAPSPSALPPPATVGPTFCTGCGQSLAVGSRFCPRCGRSSA